MKKTIAGTINTIDEYLAEVGPDKRAALEKVRKTIHAVAPAAEECISYRIPAFRLDGRMLIWFGSAADHCALYGISGEFKEELVKYDTSGKGTVRFKPDKPLPDRLVRKLVKARMAKIAERKPKAEKRKRTSPS